MVDAARDAGVTRLITVGTDVEHSRQAIAVARRHAGVWATAGVHPHDAAGGLEGLEALLAEPEVVAVGECGLDYHYDHSPRDAQRAAFAAQVAMAHAHDLALVIHTREAWDDTFDILAAEGVPAGRCCTASPAVPTRPAEGLDLGMHLSFSGIVTFKTAERRPPGRGHLPARPRCWSRPTRPTSPRCPTAANPTARRSSPWSAPRWRRPRGWTPRWWPEASLGQRRAALPARPDAAIGLRAVSVTDVLGADRRQVRRPFARHSHRVLVTEVAIVLRPS